MAIFNANREPKPERDREIIEKLEQELGYLYWDLKTKLKSLEAALDKRPEDFGGIKNTLRALVLIRSDIKDWVAIVDNIVAKIHSNKYNGIKAKVSREDRPEVVMPIYNAVKNRVSRRLAYLDAEIEKERTKGELVAAKAA